MKKFLFLALIYLAISLDTDLEKKLGPAYNYKNGGSVSCSELYVIKDTQWLDEAANSTDLVPKGVSDCVDRLLWSSVKDKYFDHCCYVRFQLEGKMHTGCVGLSEENYLDTSVTMRRMQNGDKDIWTRYGAKSKIYQLDCFSSYLKSLSIASILLLVLFF